MQCTGFSAPGLFFYTYFAFIFQSLFQFEFKFTVHQFRTKMSRLTCARFFFFFSLLTEEYDSNRFGNLTYSHSLLYMGLSCLMEMSLPNMKMPRMVYDESSIEPSTEMQNNGTMSRTKYWQNVILLRFCIG